ncbi:MAG TPA: hypothetical protein VNO31_24990, partial [Umezawaea sp.]|nr:hypothetical protein [Umezawaea sp.]
MARTVARLGARLGREVGWAATTDPASDLRHRAPRSVSGRAQPRIGVGCAGARRCRRANSNA